MSDAPRICARLTRVGRSSRGLQRARRAAQDGTASRLRAGRGGSTRLLTDVLVELGLLLPRARRQRRSRRPRVGHSAGEGAARAALDHPGAALAGDRRAVRARPPRPRRVQGRHGGRQPGHRLGGQALQRGAGRLRRTSRRWCSRCPTRPTCMAVDDIAMLTSSRSAPRSRPAEDIAGRDRADARASGTRCRRRSMRRRGRRARSRSSTFTRPPRTRPSIKLVHSIIAPGRRAGASDIHIEPRMRRGAAASCASESASTACCATRRGPQADGRRRCLADEDHGGARHLRAPDPPGRTRRPHGRRPARRRARGHGADASAARAS